jgi:hypothetical protein
MSKESFVQPSDPERDLLRKLVGLGERSLRKTYYTELRKACGSWSVSGCSSTGSETASYSPLCRTGRFWTRTAPRWRFSDSLRRTWEAASPRDHPGYFARSRNGVPKVFLFPYPADSDTLALDVTADVALFDNKPYLAILIRDVTERKRFEERLAYLGTHDPLTGLFNRTHFEATIQGMRSEEYVPLGLIICDLDGLKLINDTFGTRLVIRF